MTEAVLDASVVLKWFVPTDERGSAEARLIRDDYRAGQLIVTVPSLLFLEILNVAGRRWGGRLRRYWTSSRGSRICSRGG